MKDSEGLKSALCLLLSCSLSINHCLTNPFLAKQPPPHPKALPVWHRVTPTMLRLKSDFPSLAASGAALSTQGNASLAVSFRIYTRSSEQARSEYKPHLQR